MQATELALLTLPNVEIALQHLTSGSPHVKEAEGALLSWQDQQCNTYTFLLLCASLNPQVRLAALLSLKAVITKAWKDRGRSHRQFLDEATKQQVRYVLLSLVTTGENPLIQEESIRQHYHGPYDAASVVHDRRVQSAAASSLVQVAILDLPRKFHELIPSLVSHVISVEYSSMHRRNAAYVLDAILELLSQKRLLGDKQYMIMIAASHAAPLVQEGLRLVTMLSSDATVDSTVSETVLLLIRVLHYLLQTALPSLVESGNEAPAAVDQWMKLTLDCGSTLLSELEAGSPSNPNAVKLLPSLCKEQWELIVDVQHAHPIAFGRFLEPFLTLFYNAVFLGKNRMSSIMEPRAFLRYFEEMIMHAPALPEELTILALRFLANVVSCPSYIPDEEENEAVPVTHSATSGPHTTITSKGDAQLHLSNVQYAVHIVWTQFFCSQTVCNLADVCVCSLMALSKDKINEWAANPEDFFLSDEHGTAEDDVSAAAQNLYCGLVESSVGKQVFLPRLVSLLDEGESQLEACKLETRICSNASSDMTLPVHPLAVLWESLYTAAGLSANVFEDFGAWDFATWYRLVLGPCVALILSSQNGSRCIPLLRRRIIWLIGCNSSRLSNDSGVFKSMVEIVSAETGIQNDIAVKLTAAQVISAMVGNFEEVAEECVLLAEITINSLYRLGNECDELESQSKVLDAVSLVLAYLVGTGRDICIEVANVSVAPLGSIWDASSGHRVLIRRNVISVLIAIASSVGPRGVEQLLPMALPIVDSALDPRSSTEHSFLVAETLLLWLTTLRFTEIYTAAIGSLFVRAVEVLAIDYEHLRTIALIAESYILIGGQVFLATHGELLCKMLELTVGQVRPRGAKYMGLVLEALLREFPSEGGLLLLRSGILETMLRSCSLNYAGARQCEPDRVVALYLHSLAHVLFASPGILDSLLSLGTGVATGNAFGHKELLELYLKLLNREASDFSIQLWLKFLLSLLPFDSPQPESGLSLALTSLINPFISRCIEVWPKIKNTRNQGHYQAEYDSDEETIDIGNHQYEEMLRNSQLKDALSQVELRDLFAQKMGCVCNSDDARCGLFRESLDPALLGILKQL